MTKTAVLELNDQYQHGSRDIVATSFRTESGLSEDTIRVISQRKNEPEWMLNFRLKAHKVFLNKPMPMWGNTKLLNEINFDAITYYRSASDNKSDNWDEVPEAIKNTFDRLGIPE